MLQAEGRSFLVSLTMSWSQPSVSKTGRHGFLLSPGLVSLFSGVVLLPRAEPGWCDLREELPGERGAKAWSCCSAHLLWLEVYSLLMEVVAVAAQICSPAWVNETFFSKLLRFLIADCTCVTKLTQGSSMHAQ